jgi:hypothetical protein
VETDTAAIAAMADVFGVAVAEAIEILGSHQKVVGAHRDTESASLAEIRIDVDSPAVLLRTGGFHVLAPWKNRWFGQRLVIARCDPKPDVAPGIIVMGSNCNGINSLWGLFRRFFLVGQIHLHWVGTNCQ